MSDETKAVGPTSPETNGSSEDLGTPTADGPSEAGPVETLSIPPVGVVGFDEIRWMFPAETYSTGDLNPCAVLGQHRASGDAQLWAVYPQFDGRLRARMLDRDEAIALESDERIQWTTMPHTWADRLEARESSTPTVSEPSKAGSSLEIEEGKFYAASDETDVRGPSIIGPMIRNHGPGAEDYPWRCVFTGYTYTASGILSSSRAMFEVDLVREATEAERIAAVKAYHEDADEFSPVPSPSVLRPNGAGGNRTPGPWEAEVSELRARVEAIEAQLRQ